MMHCSNCGSDNPEGLKFCNQCGAAFNARCSQCGFDNAPGARFCGQCGAPLNASAQSGTGFPAGREPGKAVPLRPSERRHLTVLFCDLVGSTEIAARLDPEEWQETIAAYHRAAADAIGRFGGHVAKYLGDGVMAYFGYPEAHDNDGERAVHAGLAILEAVTKLNEQAPPSPDIRTSQTRFPSASSGLRLTGSADAAPSAPFPVAKNGGGERRRRLSVRVGIDSGAVVVGPGAGKETDVFGEAPNIAARVQAAAVPDTVLISAATHLLVAGLFVVEDCGARVLKGVERPMQLYRVIQPAGVRGRLAAAAASHGLTPFVGREDELRMLTSRWQRVLDGEGQVVLIIGEPGIGKSRLVQQFHQQITGTEHIWVEAAAAPFYQNTPFYPVTEALWQLVWEQSLNRFGDYLRELQNEREEYGPEVQTAPPPSPSPISKNGRGDKDVPQPAAGASPPLPDMGEGQGGGADAQLAQLQSGLISAGLNPAEAIPLIASLLHLPLSVHYTPSSLSPEQQRRRLLATLIEWLLGAARAQPLAVVIEDLHWADPSTLELIQLLMEQGASTRMLLLCTARPEFRAEGPLRAHHTQITLNRLNARNVREMIAQVAARNALATEALEAVVERTSGVPLFVEELTRAVLESGNAKHAGHEIPVTLHDSLMARLDRLGSAKEVLQIGSVIGGEFSYELLHAVYPLSDDDLQCELRRLTDADLLYVRGLPPHAIYQFKHALIRDTAYEALLKSRRKELHRLVARTIDEKFPDLKETRPEVLARHWTEAGETEQAIAEWSRAGKAAEARNAFIEAQESLQQALALLNVLSESAERDVRELELLVSFNRVLYVTKGLAAAETLGTVERMGALAEKTNNLVELAGSLIGKGFGAFFSGDLSAAIALADQALALALRSRNPRVIANVRFLQMAARCWHGDLAGTMQHFNAGLEFFDDPDFRQLSGVATGTYAVAAKNALMLGQAEASHEYLDQMTAVAEEKRAVFDLALARLYSAMVRVDMREYELAEALAAQALELSEKHQLANATANSQCVLGYARAKLGQTRGGIALIRQGIAGLLEAGTLGIGRFITFLAEAEERAGLFDEALKSIEQALQANPEELVSRPEALRIRGELRTKQGQTQLAEADFRESIALARGMGAKAWELRTTMNLARLLDQQGRRDEARAMLAEIYNWFTEGFDTPDLKDAKALLDRLGP
jgi:class 3 adenylate cyclase/tetratricopeptide (TPR) repeat protein